MLTGENISKRYGRNQILHEINLSITPGKIGAILGPSGAGKSTLLRTLSLLEDPDSGAVIVDGERHSFPISRRNGASSPWPKVTVVFQQLFLWPHLTVSGNIMLPLAKERERMGTDKWKNRTAEMESLLEFFEIGDLANRYPNQVSLGQRQRVAFVRALMLHPKYLLLDEITSALDVEHVGKILEHLKALKAHDIAILLVTHLVGFARSAADQISFMDGGRIVESGDKSILTNPRSDRFAKFLSLVEAAV